jgi:predicted choloylglycine hydrolase
VKTLFFASWPGVIKQLWQTPICPVTAQTDRIYFCFRSRMRLRKKRSGAVSYEVEAKYLELEGTSYEIGHAIGSMLAGDNKKAAVTAGPALDAGEAALARELFERWCPGLNEEIQGAADAMGVSAERMAFYAMTYLRPACSQIAVPPGMSADGHVLMARSYEFSPEYEDFTLARTSVKGKYAHLGSTVMSFGREEGINERGLGVTMSSCGFPVGMPENMRRPALRGLQFWAVIRTLLENCADVASALLFLRDMPIAYNINMLLADAEGHIALVEKLDGNTAVKNGDCAELMYAANHALLPEIKRCENMAMRNSLVRCETIRRHFAGAEGIRMEDMKALLLKSYPEGLCCHDYTDFFGTTKSMVMDLSAGRLDVCWGGLEENGWRSCFVREPLDGGAQRVRLIQKVEGPGFFEMTEL